MTSPQHELLIGTCGWQHAAWKGGFYPDDLPADWQLTYYSNEFRVVLVPRVYREACDDCATQWLEDSGESLQFVCEVDVGVHGAPDMRAVLASLTEDFAWADGLGRRNAGVLCNVSRKFAQHEDDLESILKACTHNAPVCIDCGGEAPLPWQRELLERYQAGWCWHGDSDQAAPFTGRLALTRIAGETQPRELRAIVETCLVQGRRMREADAASVSALLIDGDPPSIETARNARVIMELL
ncbi:MAG: hypothetical protein JSW10_10650 [Pseudomonadota bacterium]|nr:MAG: hypothetical protein JSW10_10650 [Pseudomonadota bacterium]